MTDSEPPQLNSATHRGPITDKDQFDEIVGVTGLRLLDDIAPEFVHAKLNEILYLAISFSLRPNAHVREIRRLRTYLEKYKSLSRDLAKNKSFPPLLPQQWLEDAEAWFEATEANTRRGRQREERREFFFPRLTGLFHFAFGVDPIVTTAESDFHHDGPLAKFATSSIEAARAYVARHGEDVGRYNPDELGAISWPLPAAPGLRKQLEEGVKQTAGSYPEPYVLKLLGATDETGRKVWEIHAERLSQEHRQFRFRQSGPRRI